MVHSATTTPTISSLVVPEGHLGATRAHFGAHPSLSHVLLVHPCPSLSIHLHPSPSLFIHADPRPSHPETPASVIQCVPSRHLKRGPKKGCSCRSALTSALALFALAFAFFRLLRCQSLMSIGTKLPPLHHHQQTPSTIRHCAPSSNDRPSWHELANLVS